MSETLDNFYSRTYTTFTGYNPIVLVWPSVATKKLIISNKKLLPQRWTIEQARQYVRYLEAEEIEI